MQVIFLKGELQNLEATVCDVRDDGKVMVLPRIEGFSEMVDCDPAELRKSFHVRGGGGALGMRGQRSYTAQRGV